MSDNERASSHLANTLLAEMEKTIPYKVAVCSAHMLLEDGALVLDAGCADGIATAYFALKNPHVHVIGLDYDDKFIQKAKSKFGHIPNVEFITDDLRCFDLGCRKLDAILNLSILHEPYSYTGYRKKTIEEIIRAELKNLKAGGVIINRDFVLPDTPAQMVYLALKEDEFARDDNPDLSKISYSGLLKLYAKEAMTFDNNDPEGHIKGFFLEEHTQRFDLQTLGLDNSWRLYYLPHQFAWEFIWRKEYRDRFYPEANEKYGFWTSQEHWQEPQKLGARVCYSAHFENPWIFNNWYAPRVALFDKKLDRLPLPPSNFLSVLEKISPEDSVTFREHRAVESPARYLNVNCFKNQHNGALFDLVSRPGQDVVDVIPYSLIDDDLILYAKHNFPRPLVNCIPRLMSANLDSKIWSGHITEPLTAANLNDDWKQGVLDVLHLRAGFKLALLPEKDEISTDFIYYTAPADLNERVRSSFVQITCPRVYERELTTHYSQFSNDGVVRSFSVSALLNAAQVGMLAEARLELNAYLLCKKTKFPMQPWIAEELRAPTDHRMMVNTVDYFISKARSQNSFVESEEKSGWLDVVRSEFHEIARENERERVMTRQEREFIVPNIVKSGDVTTNSVFVLVLLKEPETERYVIGLQKIDEVMSQFPSVQVRENHSGLLTLPGFRLPKSIDHIQMVSGWIARTLKVSAKHVQRLGEGYFPSLGVMPNRVYPYVVTSMSEEISRYCEFVCLDEIFPELEKLQDMHLMLAICRVVHALDIWPELSH
ncbi:hypothetical protein TDB9533_00560 [Thalassocella blandensis]|nr:hypothetical protein TDB9533_00560 [Thalassocella blandensis]